MEESENANEIKDDDVRNCIFKIVLCHELMHWFMNCVDSGVKNWEKVRQIRYSNYDEVSFHETFAQIVTHLYCQSQPADLKGDMVRIFDWLRKGQPPAYGRYDAMIANSIDDHEHIAILLHYMRTIDSQSYDLIERLFDFKNNPPNHNLGRLYLDYKELIGSTKGIKFNVFLV